MGKIPDHGHWMLEQLRRSFDVKKEEIDEDARLKKAIFALETECYTIGGAGHFCILRMLTKPSLMQMETLVLAATEKDVPLINLDRVYAFGKDTQIVEFYDTQLEPWPQASMEAFQNIGSRDNDLPEKTAEGSHWYDEILYPCSYHKAGKGIAERADQTARDLAAEFISQLSAAPSCDADAKREKVRVFAETLFSQGGPAVDMITRLFGPDAAKRLILNHMYGV